MSTSAELTSIHAVSPVLMSLTSLMSTGATASARAVEVVNNSRPVAISVSAPTETRRNEKPMIQLRLEEPPDGSICRSHRASTQVHVEERFGNHRAVANLRYYRA